MYPEQAIPTPQLTLIYALSVWSLIWKGIATWRAAKNNQRNWFIVMLVLNTVGILEILYLFRFAKNRLTLAEMRSWFTRTEQVRGDTTPENTEITKPVVKKRTRAKTTRKNS